MKKTLVVAASALLVLAAAAYVSAAQQRRSAADALAEPFVGVTHDGTVEGGLFEVAATGVSTGPVVAAANAFVASLDAALHEATTFPADSIEWRDWHNVHRYERKGIARWQMTPEQEAAALALLQASLSARGFTTARDIMRLNETIRELTERWDEYGEGLYHFTVMGTPSESEPWGWQLDGHHLVVNYFVLGDQVVMTPTFMGSEPVAATSGKYAGTRVFEQEEAKGLALAQSLTAEQRPIAIVAETVPRGIFTAAFRDNFVMPYEGIRATDLDGNQTAMLLDLITEYVGKMDDGHAAIKMMEVRQHLDRTYFTWMGATADDAVFYYRIHSPVLLIEFDHQGGIALETEGPTRDHIHTVMRTPNGNDYGKDLLRQHYELVAHASR
jgi:hypothetical protein